MLTKLTELKNQSSLPPEKFELIVGELLKISREKMFILQDSLELSDREINKFKLIEQQVLSGTPPQYIFKKAYFAGNKFYVDENVLVPRPETEMLVEEATKFLQNKKNVKILDLGTGCGCIAISLKKIFQSAEVTASDISKNALKTAKVNTKEQKIKVRFVASDLFQNVSGQYDLIVANLPYINEQDPLINQLADPSIALNGGKNGFAIIAKAMNELHKFLKKDGLAIFEFAYNHEKLMEKSAEENALEVKILKDLNGFTRFGLVRQKKK